jgi:hypothetical protein
VELRDGVPPGGDERQPDGIARLGHRRRIKQPVRERRQPGEIVRGLRQRWTLILAAVASLMAGLDTLVVTTAMNMIRLRLHAPDVQVARWGLPLITHLFIREPETREDYNRSVPSGDNDRFTSHIAAVIGEAARLAGSAAGPAACAQRAVGKLGVMTLPCRLGTPASFGCAGFNGRGLGDEVMDVVLSLAANSALGDGVAPDPARIGGGFPYFRAA